MTSCNFENYNSSPSHPSVLRQSLNLNGILSKPASDSRMGQEDADFDKLAETHWCWSGVEPPQWISRSRSIRRRDKMFLAVKSYETFTYAENQFSLRQKQLWTGCVTYFDGWYLLTLNLKPWKALKCVFCTFSKPRILAKQTRIDIFSCSNPYIAALMKCIFRIREKGWNLCH